MSTSTDPRGVLWAIGALLLCPCHLPLTLWLLGTLFYGTVAGALLHEHPYVAGSVITAIWFAATWQAVRLLRATERCAVGGDAKHSGRTRNFDPLRALRED